jgi:hypothetical protein
MIRRFPPLLLLACAFVVHADPWLSFPAKPGSANGKKVVLLSGDEEYRSEEGLPQLAKILSQKHGFDCIVLLSQDDDGTVNPNNQTNIPGMHLLGGADLVICQFRFRELPDEGMKHFVDYLESGKPMMVLRTATHAFDYSRNKKSPYAKYSWTAPGGGFGGMTIGETWTYHHGNHGHEGTRGLIEGKNKDHPVLKGVKDVFGLTDVYGVNPDFPGDATVLLQGATLRGLAADDAVNIDKPLMPIAWLRDYRGESGKTSKMFCSTIGAAIDMKSADLRRLFVNTAYFLTGLPAPINADVATVGDYNPSMFGFNKFKKGVKVDDLR